MDTVPQVQMLDVAVYISHSARYLSVPPTRQDLTQGIFYGGGLGEGKVGHKLRLMPCRTMLVISSLGAI